MNWYFLGYGMFSIPTILILIVASIKHVKHIYKYIIVIPISLLFYTVFYIIFLWRSTIFYEENLFYAFDEFSGWIWFFTFITALYTYFHIEGSIKSKAINYSQIEDNVPENTSIDSSLKQGNVSVNNDFERPPFLKVTRALLIISTVLAGIFIIPTLFSSDSIGAGGSFVLLPVLGIIFISLAIQVIYKLTAAKNSLVHRRNRLFLIFDIFIIALLLILLN